ncbi:Succinyl-CoA ligase [ADP-forming] beta chain [hydrothermal vent metagenome]|uniref:Succinyl-CoA ligase [ADP-forming] beta chain n=1 Tax=hydrothermal vent metagenome TaxID=652676 RepID=A0A3B1A6C0_9ZZZZ
MNIHEFQAKALFREYGVPVPDGEVTRTVDGAMRIAKELDGERWVVKAQVHAGGRGKAGGVKVVESLQAVVQAAESLLGTQLVTGQSGPDGQPVDQVLIEKPTSIDRELYLGMLVDRASERVVVMASAAGGMDIEEVARDHPEKLYTLYIDPVVGLQAYQCRQVIFALGLAEHARQMTQIMQALYQLYIDKDISLVEINPLVVSADGLMAIDAKINFDDNALYRHKHKSSLRDLRQEDEKEAQAQVHGLSYVSLDGDIACMVNGAGLAMATMDMIKYFGAEPANFLDVGGGTTAEKVAEAFKIILSDEKVKAILVNIFGGIVRCDLIAEGIIKAIKEVSVAVPVVVRLEGTNVEQGQKLLAECDLDIISAVDLDDAASKAVAATKAS